MRRTRQARRTATGRETTRGSSIRAAFGCIGLLLAIGCAAPAPSSPRHWMLDDGRTLGEWVEGLLNPGRRVRPALVLLLAAWFLAGCGSGEESNAGGTPSGPTLVPVDSVLLAESDSVYIGKPGSPAVDPYDGSIYVPDFFSNQVYRFGRDGRLLQVYGGPGEGPGEFRTVGAVYPVGDSVIGVVDAGNNRITYFYRSSGARLSERELRVTPGMTPPLPLDSTPETVWVHAYAPGTRKSILRLVTGPDSPDRQAALIGRLPATYLRSYEEGGRFASFYALGGYFATSGEAFFHGYEALNWIYIRDHRAKIVDSVYLPAMRRKGIPSDLREKLDRNRIPLIDAMELHSTLRGLHVLPDGNVAVVHHDKAVIDRNVIPPPTAAVVWVSLLSEDLERGCVDAKLSESHDAKPMEAFRGDTVFQLERRIRDKSGHSPSRGVETWIRMVRINPSGCDWIPARPPPDRG